MRKQDSKWKKKYVLKNAKDLQKTQILPSILYDQKNISMTESRQSEDTSKQIIKDMMQTFSKVQSSKSQTKTESLEMRKINNLSHETQSNGNSNNRKKDWFNKPQKKSAQTKKYVTSCDKYMDHSYLLDNDSHGLDDKIKKLKKIFLERYTQVKQLKIYVAKLYPMIYFEFKEDNQTRYMNFRETLTEIPSLRDIRKRQLFEHIFGRLFHQVDKKYFKLAVFGIEKAKEVNIKLHWSNIFNVEEGHEVMFYYTFYNNTMGIKGSPGKHVKFLIFDKFLLSCQFTCNFVEQNKRIHPDEYALFQKFKNKIFAQQRLQGQLTDLMNNQEMESDDERATFEDTSVEQCKTEIQKLIDKDLTPLQDQIEKITDEILTIANKNRQDQTLAKLGDQLQYLEENKANFQSIRQTVVLELAQLQTNQNSHLSSKQFYKRSLKKMILAEKQIESKLPIIGKKRRIFELLKHQNLLIIEGETGSGKSTQLPQMLCQLYGLLDNPKELPVLVTQPRRLATRSMAERVAKQMGEEVGGFVDYLTGANKNISEDAKIIFKLDRLVLDELTDDPVLSNYSCLVIDQAHERTISIDVILGLVKQLLNKRDDFKVIVTSASMNIHLFESYFSTKALKITGRMFPVTITYKDYVKYKQGDKFQQARKIERVINEQILHDNSSMKNQFKGHLLCFCSNLDEINQLVKIYSEKLNKSVFLVYPLHGKITPAEQRLIFKETRKHKFIFASRIAETAITIDGVRVVIDPGKDVELVYDQNYKLSSMKMRQITQSSAKQRAGRSGRTGPGHCFRLYSQQNFKQREVNKIPEIENSSLQTVVLRLKTLKVDDVLNFAYISKPSIEGLKRSIELLKLIGALSDKEDKVTKIGELLIKIPIQPFLSRAIIEGIMFQKALQIPNFYSKLKLPQQQLNQISVYTIQNTVIQILALLVNFSNLFFVKKQEREEDEKKKFQFSDEEGDLFFLDNIFMQYKQMKEKGNYKDKIYMNTQLSQWVRQNYLNVKVLNQTEDLVREISQIIKDFAIKASVYEEELDNAKSKLLECKTYRQIILSCLITSFSPNLCKYSGNPQIGYTMVSQKRPLQIYGTSNLSLLGIPSDWIICYDLYTNEMGKMCCKVAHAITYDFIKRHIDKYVWQTFKINQIQQHNPFYREISYDLPTKILQQIRFDYYKSENDQRLIFFKEAFLVLSEEQNKVSFFFAQQEKENNSLKNKKDAQILIDFQKSIESYLLNIRKKLAKSYRHNYIGNITVNMQNGYQIQCIEFNNIQFFIEIISEINLIQIIAADCADIEQFAQYVVEDLHFFKNSEKTKYKNASFQNNKRRIKMFNNKNRFLDHLNELKKAFPKIEMEIKETLVDKRRKIPQTKIILHFFAGKCKHKNAFMFYEDAADGSNPAERMCQIIQMGISNNPDKPRQQRLQRLGHPYRWKLTGAQLKVSKKGNGINIYRVNMDEMQIADQLFKMDKQKLFGFDFKFPKFIQKFRLPQISQACKDDGQWKQEIYSLLEEVNVKTENLAINVQGYYKPNINDRKNNKDKSQEQNKFQETSAFKKTLRVNMTAEITTLDQSILSKMKKAFDGKAGKLGCQKLHIITYYDQVVAMPSLKTFHTLEEEYYFQIDKFKVSYPLMNFTIINRRVRNKEKVMIVSCSPNKQDFINTQRTIARLFTSKLIKLQFSEFRFLDKMPAGVEIIEEIERDYSYKVHFCFERFNHCLKVYCEDSEVKVIEAKIKERINRFQYYTEKISYIGKNLNKVKKILDDKITSLSKGTMLNYQIMFRTREVLVTADIATFQQTKNNIMKLVKADKVDCGICTDIMIKPYRFLNCKCCFCWLCLTDHVRAFRNSPDAQKLICPNDNCQVPINVNDVKTLLSQDEFQSICDIKIGNYVKRNNDKYLSCNFCENLFDKKDTQKIIEFNCDICGRYECIKCLQSHPNYTCEQWKNKDNLSYKIQKRRVKNCPSCKQHIAKNKESKNLKCVNCKTHICWKCLKTFKTDQQCHEHFTKQCGIFDSDEDED